MTTTVVQSEMPVKLSGEQAWALMSDYSLAHNYVPGVIDTEIISESKQGVGAVRLVYQKPEKALAETVVEWTDGTGFVIRVHNRDGSSMKPFVDTYFHYGMEEREGQVWLTNSMRYELKPGLFSQLLNKLVLRPAIQANLKKITASQARWYDSQYSES